MLNDLFFNLDNEIIRKNFFIKEKDLLLWPLIRFRVFFHIQQKLEKLSDSSADRIKETLKNIKFPYYTLRYSPLRLKKTYDIIFFNIDARGRLNDKNFNIYADYYSALESKSLVIDESFKGRYFIPDNTEDFAVGEYGELKAYIIYLIKCIFKGRNVEHLEKLLDLLKQNENTDENFIDTVIRKLLYYFYYGYEYYRNFLVKIFNKLKPRIIFVRAGSYGGIKALLLKTAKDMGIITGEFQHGAIFKNNFAYNYDESILNCKKYSEYLPDYILTYGDFWNNQIKISAKVLTIGNPHFYERLKKYQDIKEQNDTILIVSQGTLGYQFVEITKYLSEKLPSYKILYKLHPGELPLYERYEVLKPYPNITIAKSGDIYEYIARYENIIACYSTTVFEAMGFNKKIFILDNNLSRNFIPMSIGKRFKEKSELIDLIKNTTKEELKYNLDYYFNSKWRSNYKNFLKHEITIK